MNPLSSKVAQHFVSTQENSEYTSNKNKSKSPAEENEIEEKISTSEEEETNEEEKLQLSNQGADDLRKKLMGDTRISQVCTLSQQVRVGEMLGEGAYGQVFKALNLETGNFLAVKVMKIPNYNPNNEKSL